MEHPRVTPSLRLGGPQAPGNKFLPQLSPSALARRAASVLMVEGHSSLSTIKFSGQDYEPPQGLKGGPPHLHVLLEQWRASLQHH